MKRLFFILIVSISIVALYVSPTDAAFELTITQHSEGIHFGNMDMGSIKYDIPKNGLIVSCLTDSTVGWTLDIEAQEELASTSASGRLSTIPNAIFRWYVESATPGNTSYTPEQRNDFQLRRTVYTGLNGETQADITMKFELVLPTLFQAGTYTIGADRIVFTLTE